MSNILFADFGQAISQAESVLNSRAQRNAFADERAAEQADAPHVAAALKGDRTALDRVSPKTAIKLAPYLEKMDAGQRAKAKEAAEYTARSAHAILQTAPAERPALYAQLIEEGKALGFDMSKMQPRWTPDLEYKMRHFRDAGLSIMEQFKLSEAEGGGLKPMPAPGGGGNPAAAISSIESGGKYDAVGPVANAQGNRAYGKYQVLDSNIGPWTQEVLGKPMTPQEFLANPQAQDAVFKAKFGQYQQKHGPEGAARAWFAGEGGMNNPNAKDVLGTTVAGYGQKFTTAMGGAAPPGMAQGDGGPPGSPPPAGQAPPPMQGGEIDDIRRRVRANGGDLFTKGGNLEINNGHYVVRSLQNPNVIVGMIPVKAKEQGAEKGLFGDSLTGRALTALRTMDPGTQDYAAAYAILSKPSVVPDGEGGQRVIQPMDLSMFPKPAFGGGGQPMPGATPPANQTQLPGGGTSTQIPGKGKPLDNSARDDLKKIADTALELPQLLKAFDPSFGGYMYSAAGDAANFAKRNLPDALGGADPKGQAQWWQRYNNFANLERNKLFGSALTPGETAAFNAAMVNSGMKSDQIKANLERQSEIAQKALSRIANSLKASGYNAEAIEALTGTPFSAMPSPEGAVPQAPPKGTGNRPPLESFGR